MCLWLLFLPQQQNTLIFYCTVLSLSKPLSVNLPTKFFWGLSWHSCKELLGQGGTLGFFIPAHQIIVRPKLATSLFRRHKLEKKHECGDRIHVVDRESFTPLFFNFWWSRQRRYYFLQSHGWFIDHRSTTPVTIKHSPGCIVCCPFPCYVLQYLPFVGADYASQ